MIPQLAIVVEWDNARISEVERAEEMLRRLYQQAAEIARSSNGSIDLILVFDPEEMLEDIPRTVLARCVDVENWPGMVSLVAAPGQSYYSQKNFGVTKTNAEIIVFIDSDVIPDDGWLKQIYEAFHNSGVNIVGGETYLSTDSYYDRLCAAFWNFDVKRSGAGLYEATNFYANNVAFRGDVARKYSFPGGDTFRGQCSALARRLRRDGIKLYRIRSASVSHPPPEGARHFIHRAVCQGHDAYLDGKQKKHSFLLGSPIGSLFRYAKSLFNAPKKIFSRRRLAGLSVVSTIPAYGLAVIYSTLMFMGEIATAVSPAFVRRYFNI